MGHNNRRLQLAAQHVVSTAHAEHRRLVLQRRLEEEPLAATATTARPLLRPQQIISRRRLLVLQPRQPTRVGLEVGEQDAGHGLRVLVPHLLGHLAVNGLQELKVELEAEDAVLRHLVVGQRLLELVDLVEEIFADFGDGADLELLNDVFDVGAALGIAKALLVEKGDLVVEDVQLLQELGLNDRHLEKKYEIGKF